MQQSVPEQELMNDVKHIALIAGLWFAYSSSVYADADRVFINSKIITVNDQFAIEQAIAVKDSRIYR